MPYVYGIDSTYIILVIPAMLLAFWAQYKVSATYARYSKVRAGAGLTGAQIARRILDQHGLTAVKVEYIAGKLTDHFDPRTNIVRLSDTVYSSTSVAAVGVAAHEVGHAIQYATGYTPMKLRAAIIPVTQLGSMASIPLILLGMVFSFPQLITAGIVLFATVAVFQLITLPVEFNASRRALATLDSQNILSDTELSGARKVLGAAAMTYVAALIVALAQLLRLVLLYGRRRN